MPDDYLFSTPQRDDPYPYYRELRDEDPAHYSATEDIWVHHPLRRLRGAFSDWQTWSSQRRGNLLNDMPQRIGKTLGTTDPPRHTQARKLVNKAFTPAPWPCWSRPSAATPRRSPARRASRAPSSTCTTSPPRSTPTCSGPCSACPRTTCCACARGWTTSSPGTPA